MLNNKQMLITGGAGCFGSEFVHYIYKKYIEKSELEQTPYLEVIIALYVVKKGIGVVMITVNEQVPSRRKAALNIALETIRTGCL